MNLETAIGQFVNSAVNHSCLQQCAVLNYPVKGSLKKKPLNL